MKAEYDFSKGKRGALAPQKGKTRISIFIDNSVLDEFRARAQKAGTGYQTMMNDALRQYLSQTDQPITEKTLRNVLRQEMPEYLRGFVSRPARKGRKLDEKFAQMSRAAAEAFARVGEAKGMALIDEAVKAARRKPARK